MRNDIVLLRRKAKRRSQKKDEEEDDPSEEEEQKEVAAVQKRVSHIKTFSGQEVVVRFVPGLPPHMNKN